MDTITLFANIALSVCPIATKPEACPKPTYPEAVKNITVTLSAKSGDTTSGVELIKLAKEGVEFTARIEVVKEARGPGPRYTVKATLSDSSGGEAYPEMAVETDAPDKFFSGTLRGLPVRRHEMRLTPWVIVGTPLPLK